MENEQQDLLSGLVDDGSEYELGDLSEEEEEEEDLHLPAEDQDAGAQEGDDQFGADAEEAPLRAQVSTSQFTTPISASPAQNGPQNELSLARDNPTRLRSNGEARPVTVIRSYFALGLCVCQYTQARDGDMAVGEPARPRI